MTEEHREYVPGYRTYSRMVDPERAYRWEAGDVEIHRDRPTWMYTVKEPNGDERLAQTYEDFEISLLQNFGEVGYDLLQQVLDSPAAEVMPEAVRKGVEAKLRARPADRS